MGFAGPAPPSASAGPVAQPAGDSVSTRRLPAPRSVVLVFVPAGEAELASALGMSVGIMSATQGSYTPAQLLLDITQGARVARSAYSSANPPPMSLRTSGTAGAIVGWQAALRRAAEAPQLLHPGLLASSIPGGGAYVGTAGTDHVDAIAAADRGGHIAAVSLGGAPTLLARVARVAPARRPRRRRPAGRPSRARQPERACRRSRAR